MLPEFDASIEAVTNTLPCSTQEEVPLCLGYEIVRGQFNVHKCLLLESRNNSLHFIKFRCYIGKVSNNKLAARNAHSTTPSHFSSSAATKQVELRGSSV